MSLICAFVWLTESAALSLPCETWANICGINDVVSTSSTAAFTVPGYPMLCVYFCAIVVRTVYLPFGGCVSCAASLRIPLKEIAFSKTGKL